MDVSVSAHRDEGHVRWQCHVQGIDGSVSMAFLETECTRLPTFNLEGSSTGELADSVDAHYLFEFLTRELLTESTVF